MNRLRRWSLKLRLEARGEGTRGGAEKSAPSHLRSAQGKLLDPRDHRVHRGRPQQPPVPPVCSVVQDRMGLRYLISALAPASINFFKIASESALDTPSLTGLGAPSTRSLASFSPSPVSSRTALITLTLFSPAALSITVNSVFSSTAAAAPPPPAGAATATVAAAADTPNLSSRSLISCDSSNTDMLEIASRISAFATDISLLLNQYFPVGMRAIARRPLVACRGRRRGCAQSAKAPRSACAQT